MVITYKDHEAALIACLIETPSLLTTEILDILPTADYFQEVSAQAIYQLLIEFDKESKRPSRFLIQRALGQAAEPTLITSREHAGLATDAKYYADKILKNYQTREIAKLAVDLASIRDVEESDHIIKKIDAVLRPTENKSVLELEEVLSDSWEQMAANKYADEKLLQTNFNSLDTILQGIPKKALVVLGARPGIGKTSFALELLNQFAKQCAVAMYSLEMTTDELGVRLISAGANIPANKIKTGQTDERDQDQIANYINRERANKIYISDDPRLNIHQLRRKVKALKAKDKNLGVVIIDYLQLLSSGTAHKSRYEEVTEISRELKIIAGEFDVVIFALSQLSRALEQRNNKRPMLSDIRDSGSIEQDANQVWFLHREPIEGKMPDTIDLELVVAKNRSGPVGVTSFSFIRSKTKYIDVGGIRP